MRRFLRLFALSAIAGSFCIVTDAAVAGRFGGGGGGGGGFRGGGGNYGGGGGYRGGGNFGGGAPMARPAPTQAARPAQTGTVHGPYGGSVTGGRQSGPVAGPGGATGVAGRQGGAYTGPRGGYAVGGARGGSVTTPGGSTVTGGSRGNVYTGPRGATVVSGGKAGTVTGPGGNTVGGAKAGAVVIGPNGNVHATGGKVGGASGPGGTVVAGSKGAVTAGPGGVVASGSRGAIASGPNGVVAGGSRAVAGTGPGGSFAYGTRYVGASNLAGQGAFVRQGYGHYNCFRPGWYANYPGAWAAAGFVAGSAYSAASWGSACSSVGYSDPQTPYAYDYGDNITYQDGNVYYGDQPAGTEVQYAEQASQIADAGAQAKPPADDKWEPLGVFAMVKGDEQTSNDIFQLAMNKEGIIRGNYYNALTDAATPVAGSLNKKNQRVAWTIGDKKFPVYEAGLFNLTKDDTTMLVHMAKDKTEQLRLFRIAQPKDGQ